MVSTADLASVPLFAELDEAQLVELAGWFEMRDVSAGTRLTGEGIGATRSTCSPTAPLRSRPAAIRSRASGRATSSARSRSWATARSATVTTTVDSTVLALFGTDFRRLQDTQPAIAESIAAAMRRRVG